MNKKYDYLFFDLDHTLWDFDANAQEVLTELYHAHDLANLGIPDEAHFWERFYVTNNGLWEQYNAGQIDKFFLRNERFRLIFEAAGAVMSLVSDEFLKEFNKQFLQMNPQKSKLMPGAMELLESLKGKYPMFIITNGFEEVQSVKLASAGIDHFFERVITSEKAGFKKPYAGIFTYAMKWCQAHPERSLMIGDNLAADIVGARDFGIDQVYFNPEGTVHEEEVTYEVRRLEEIHPLLHD